MVFSPFKRTAILLPAIVICLQLSCVRLPKSGITQARALSEVKVKTAVGWQEAMSAEGRFRIIFPGEFVSDVDAHDPLQRGFKLVQPESQWFVYYRDYDRPMPADEQSLRKAYHGSIAATTRNGQFLLGQKDVFLHQRLGSEFVTDGPGRLSYMRTFVAGRRIYTLSVDRKVGDAAVNAKLPPDIQQFFDSFTYWDQ